MTMTTVPTQPINVPFAMTPGDIVEVTLALRAEPVTAIVVAGNGDGDFILDVVDESGENKPMLCHTSEVLDYKVYDPSSIIAAA